VHAILSSGVDPNMANRKGITPISAAAHKGNIQILSALIQAGAEVNGVNMSGSTALIQVLLSLCLLRLHCCHSLLLYIYCICHS
jgi:ankyrin repeat protein